MSELDDLQQLHYFDSHGLLARAAAWPGRRDAVRDEARALAAMPAPSAQVAWLCLLPPELLPLGRLAAALSAAPLPDDAAQATGSPVWVYSAPVRRGTHPTALLAAVPADALHKLGPAPSAAHLETVLTGAPRQDLTQIADAERHLTDSLFDLIALFSQGSHAPGPVCWLPQPDPHLDAALATLAPEVPLVDNPAKQLAHQLHERLPVFWGTDESADLAALWAMRQQWFAERAAFATTAAEVARLGVLERLPRYWPNAAIFVQLAATHSDAELTDAVTHILARRRFPTHSIALPPALSTRAALVYLLELGEWVALYAAYLSHADPSARTAHRILFEP